MLKKTRKETKKIYVNQLNNFTKLIDNLNRSKYDKYC